MSTTLRLLETVEAAENCPASKVCFKCNRLLPLEAFYPHAHMADKHLGKCMECTKRDGWELQRRLRADPEWLRKERARGVAKQTAYNKMLAVRCPEKFNARRTLREAVRSGTVTKPESCQVCFEPKSPRALQGHHWAYSRPLDVTWACATCHAVLDGRARPETVAALEIKLAQRAYILAPPVAAA